MKRPFLVASDLGPYSPVDETQRKNGNSTDWDELDVILRAYRYAIILVGLETKWSRSLRDHLVNNIYLTNYFSIFVLSA